MQSLFLDLTHGWSLNTLSLYLDSQLDQEVQLPHLPSIMHLSPVQFWSSIWFPSQSFPPLSAYGLSQLLLLDIVQLFLQIDQEAQSPHFPSTMHLPQVQFWSSLRFPWQSLPPLSGRGLSQLLLLDIEQLLPQTDQESQTKISINYTSSSSASLVFLMVSFTIISPIFRIRIVTSYTSPFS